MDIITCRITGKEFSNLRGFCNHLRGLKISSRQYYDTYVKKPDEGICMCQAPTNWAKWGYGKWCSYNCPILTEHRKKSVKERFQGPNRAEKNKPSDCTPWVC